MNAGTSAQGQYRRRRLRTVAAGLVASVGAAAGAWAGFEHLAPATGMPMGIAGFVIVAWLTLSRDPHKSWRVGAAGERRTAEYLSRLPAGYLVLHDRRLPGLRANLDHLVVGQTGVFTVETKVLAGRVRVRWGRLRVDGRRRPDLLDQAHVQADVAGRAIGVPVQPVLCVHAAQLPRRAKLVSGVWIVGGDRLPKLLRRGTRALSRRDVRALGRRADACLAPAAQATARTGSTSAAG